jgi:hypothetical protein
MCTAAGGVAPCDDAATCERDRGEGFPDLILGDGLFEDALATGGLLTAELGMMMGWNFGLTCYIRWDEKSHEGVIH